MCVVVAGGTLHLAGLYIISYYQACALRALGLLLYSRILQWEGGRLFDMSAGFFYGNSCNSGTESRKIVPKVGN